MSGRSAMAAKVAAAKKRMYTPEQAMMYEKCDCDPKGRPNQAEQDRLADEKLSGRFKIVKNNLCPDCRQYRSANGVCGCYKDE